MIAGATSYTNSFSNKHKHSYPFPLLFSIERRFRLSLWLCRAFPPVIKLCLRCINTEQRDWQKLHEKHINVIDSLLQSDRIENIS